MIVTNYDNNYFYGCIIWYFLYQSFAHQNLPDPIVLMLLHVFVLSNVQSKTLESSICYNTVSDKQKL